MTTSHPNRSGRKPGRNPKPEEIRQLREDMERTQTEFGELVYRGRDVVAKWESGERRCPPDTWEFLCLLQAFPEFAQMRQDFRDGRPTSYRRVG